MRSAEKARLMANNRADNCSYSILFMDKIGKIERDNYIRIAKELGYSQDVVDRINKAETENEVSRILATARHEAIDRERERERRKHHGR